MCSVNSYVLYHLNVCTVTADSYEVAAGCNVTLHKSFVSIVYNHNMSSNAELNHKWNKPAAITNLLYIGCIYTRPANSHVCVLLSFM